MLVGRLRDWFGSLFAKGTMKQDEPWNAKRSTDEFYIPSFALLKRLIRLYAGLGGPRHSQIVQEICLEFDKERPLAQIPAIPFIEHPLLGSV